MTTPEDSSESPTKNPSTAPVIATKPVENQPSNDAVVTSQIESVDNNSDPNVKSEPINDANEPTPVSVSVTAARPPPIPKSVPNLPAVSTVQGVVTKVPKKEPSPIVIPKSSPVTNTEAGTTNRSSSIAMPARKKSSTGMSTNPSSPIPSQQQQQQSPSGDVFSVDIVEKSMSKIADGLRKKLKDLENEIDKDEEQYISKTWAHGNVMRGWDGFIRRVDRVEKQPTGNGAGVGTGAPKTRKPRPNDRFFSLSSATSKYRRDNPDIFIQKRGVMMKKKRKR